MLFEAPAAAPVTITAVRTDEFDGPIDVETHGRELEYAGPTVKLRVVPRPATAGR